MHYDGVGLYRRCCTSIKKIAAMGNRMDDDILSKHIVVYGAVNYFSSTHLIGCAASTASLNISRDQHSSECANRKRESASFCVNFFDCFRNTIRLHIKLPSRSRSDHSSDNDSNCNTKKGRKKNVIHSRFVCHSHYERLFLIVFEIKRKTEQITPAGIRVYCSVSTRKHLIN